VRYFESLAEYMLKWELTQNGNVVANGEIDSLDIAAQSEMTYELINLKDYNLKGDCFFTATVHQTKAMPWADKGYEIGFMQFEVEAAKDEATVVTNPLSV
jgi:beta-galactosidase